MSRVLTNEKNYYDIADTIRQMKEVDTTYMPREMSSALKDIYSNEVEGVLPLSFESNGLDLLNYRIDGASGGVGDLITDISDDNYGKYKVPVVVNGKNLLKPDGTPTTIRGVSWSYREDGTVVGKRVSSNENVSDFTLTNSSTFAPGSYIFSRFDTESTPGSSTYQSNISINGVSHWGTGNYLFVLNEASTIKVVLRVYSNFTGTAIFKPMIRISSIQESNFETYIEPTTTNIYLDEPIDENESISLSDTNVDILTIEGTNVLTIDTTVQPSNVYVQAPKDNEEIVFLTTVLEEGI